MRMVQVGTHNIINYIAYIIGSIGIEELEKPLISLGLCNNRHEV